MSPNDWRLLTVAVLAFAACMRDNGVDMEDPTVDADGNIRLNFRGNAGPGEEGFDRRVFREDVGASPEKHPRHLQVAAEGVEQGEVAEHDLVAADRGQGGG